MTKQLLPLLLVAWAAWAPAAFSSGAGSLAPQEDGCPAGQPALALPSLLAGSSSSGVGFSPDGGFRTKPRTFARASGIAWKTSDLLSNGSWATGADGSRSWRLCLVAPSGTSSLTIAFRRLRLPLGAELYIYSPEQTQDGRRACAAGCQKLTLRSARRGEGVLAAPVPGSVAVLQYYEPPGLRHWQRRRLSLQVQTVLLGTQPLSWASAAATAAFSSKARQAAPALSQAPGVTARAAAQSGAARLGVAPSDRVANVDSTKVGGSLNAAVDLARGTALACQPNVECNSEWAAEANAVVLLVGVEAAGDTGFYCTATLINSPTGEQLLVSANHCLGYASASDTEILWGVLVNYDLRCGSRSGTRPPQYMLLQGLDLLWTNEETDVMLLRLEDEIPEVYRPYYLGWDATAWAAPPNGSVCIHHPAGDTKAIAYTSAPLQRAQYLIRQPTHYQVVWREGAMETGSSGSMLIDAITRLGLGPLTGGVEFETCTGGRDIYGSLYAAWDLGLGDHLGGPEGVRSMGPRQPQANGPGLLVDPDLVVVEEGSGAGVLRIRLSEAPAEELRYSLNVTGSGGAAAPVLLGATELYFNTSNWDQPQQVTVTPGNDGMKDGLEPFTITLQLSSAVNASLAKWRSVPGVRLDDETPEGTSPQRPISVALPADRTFSHSASLAARPPGALAALQLTLSTLADFQAALLEGTAVYYAFNTAKFVELSMDVCSKELVPRLYVFSPDGVVQWSTGEGCSVDSTDPCVSYEGSAGCSGYQKFWLLGTEGAGPYLLAAVSRDGTAGSFSFTLQVTSKQ